MRKKSLSPSILQKEVNETLKHILGSNISEFLITSEESAIRAKDFLVTIDSNLDSILTSFNLPPSPSKSLDPTINSIIRNYEKELVQILNQPNLKDSVDVTQIADFLLSKSTSYPKQGTYLSNDAAKDILEKQPPLNLLKSINCKNVTDALAVFDAREIIGMSRQSEDYIWHERYMEILSKLKNDAFKKQNIRRVVIDSALHQNSILGISQKPKPWRMTHSKEAGVIICYTQQIKTSFQTPLLLFILVFLHYLHEVSLSGSFFRCKKENPKGLVAKKVLGVINADKNKFKGFSSNVYSETIFWKRTMKELSDIFSLDKGDVFEKSLHLGTRLNNKEMVSLNFVDHVWDLNLMNNNESNMYFESIPNNKFLYHFREAFWYNLFARVHDWDKNKMEEEVLNSMHVGDKNFTIMHAE